MIMNTFKNTATTFQSEVIDELVTNILPFYIKNAIDEKKGGFHGFITNDLHVVPDAPKALIQNSRILWTFSHAFRILGNHAYLSIANRAYAYLLEHFWDPDYGGFYWMLTSDGNPKDFTKMTYGQAFCIYGLSEYFLAVQNPEAIAKALETYRLIEQHFADRNFGGYFEGGSRDWIPSDKASLDTIVAVKSMNTQLHVLEAYTNLLRVHDDSLVRRQLDNEIHLMLEHVIDHTTWHFKMHFDADWRAHNNNVSYGHDIEGSWLLVEASEIIGDASLLFQVEDIAVKMVQATYAEGLEEDGSLPYERGPHGLINPNKDWWTQAESMVGFLNGYQISRNPHFYDASLRAWQFIQAKIIDREHGEWLWGITPDGQPVAKEKSGPWKCPYHNSRACLEVYRRLSELIRE
jgi:mannobiose 2-epimerase